MLDNYSYTGLTIVSSVFHGSWQWTHDGSDRSAGDAYYSSASDPTSIFLGPRLLCFKFVFRYMDFWNGWQSAFVIVHYKTPMLTLSILKQYSTFITFSKKKILQIKKEEEWICSLISVLITSLLREENIWYRIGNFCYISYAYSWETISNWRCLWSFLYSFMLLKIQEQSTIC